MFQTVTLVRSSRPAQAVEPTLLAATQGLYEQAFEQGESTEALPLSEGQLVAGKYSVEHLLGAGAAEARPGLVRAASGGTLFLDEIGELPVKSQAKLLRVLQEGEVLPLGETRPVAVDVRLVTATHKNLAAQLGEGGFRDDFYGRLAGYELELLPSRERKEDLGLIARVLLERLAGARASELHFQPKAARALFAYDWPRNVRELELALAAAIALSEDGKIRYDYLPSLLRRSLGEASLPEPADLEQRLRAALEQHAGNLSAVGREMGKDRVQIRRWCKRFDIDLTRYRTS